MARPHTLRMIRDVSTAIKAPATVAATATAKTNATT
jgi:hypothetical protein